jgi:Holliday junction resolvasome RuvABC endonuclease subunit
LKRVAAFDLSSNTGWSVWDGVADAPTLGKKRVLHWDRDEGIMLEGWRQWLGRFLREHTPEAVAVEAPALGTHTDAPTIYRQAMIRGMLLWGCHVSQPSIPVYSIPPASWRKTFIGFGKKPKDRTESWKQLACQRCNALGWDYPDHNAAESSGVLHHLLTVTLGLTPPWAHRDQMTLPLTEIKIP